MVVLQLVESDELAIHSPLSSIKSGCSHMIPIHDQIALGNHKVIAMPVELALKGVPNALFKPGLACQF